MTLGSEVRRCRLALGLTLDELSERSGLSPHYLSTLENGHRDPRVSTLLAVAKALRVNPSDLLGNRLTVEGQPGLIAIYERAPPEAREAIATLLRLLVAPRSRRIGRKLRSKR
jgi:transcriptional regulator with XRE-family HTH domain